MTKAIPVVAVAETATEDKCVGCRKAAPKDTVLCKACKKCKNCRKHYRCATKHKTITHHCPEFKKQCRNCRSCEKECKCWECNHCKGRYGGNRINERCTKKTCGRCINCCVCVKCRACALRGVSAFFDNTNSPGYCRRCTSCEEDCRCPAVNFSDDRARVVFVAAKEFKKNPSKRFVSAEIEVAGCKKKDKIVNDVIDSYKAVVKTDGSLPRGGFEINTSPSNGDTWLTQINEICDAIKKQKGFVTKECGLHVHVDARDFDYLDLARLALIYAKVEDELYSLVDESRKRSTYCRPCGKYYAKALTNMESVTNKDVRQSRVRDVITGYGEGYGGDRYHGLNLHAYFAHKTVECRMHQGTIDPEVISHWGMLWASILDYAKSVSDRDVANLTLKGFDLLIEIANSDTLKEWLREKDQRISKLAKAPEAIAV